MQHWSRAAPIAVLMLSQSVAAASQDWLRLASPFEEGVHAAAGAANPFAAAGNVEIVPAGGGRGNVLQFAGHDENAANRSALIYAGVNVPHERGTIGLSLRWTGTRRWDDGKRTWLLVLMPQAGESRSAIDDDGTALVLYKDEDNVVKLGVYQLHGQRLTLDLRSRKSGYEIAAPDAIAAKCRVKKLAAGEWVRLRMGWDRKTGRVWLGVGRRTFSGRVKLRKAVFECLLVGTPTNIDTSDERGFDGQIDDLVIDARTPGRTRAAGMAVPADLPAMAKPPRGKVAAVLLRDDPVGSLMESVVRSHLANVMRCQHANGGWAFGIAWPNGASFLSGSVVLPYTQRYFNGSKDGNSSYCALMLLSGYRALGERAYLDAAERTAATILRLQADDGHWPYGARFDAKASAFKTLFSDDRAPLEDHVQSHPTCLLWLLHELTGKEAYKTAGDKGRDFIRMAQNPNGSWSHHYSFETNCGRATRSEFLRGGEINDDTTGDQMMVMLVAYRRTGEVKYLASFLRAADWLVDAFIDDKGKGWAQQYDEHNKPIPARHFEPPAISLSEGIHSAPRMLMRAYRLTGEVRYLDPLRKWRKWMLDNRTFTNDEKTAWGWHAYYDPRTGEAFRMFKQKRLPADPRAVSERGYTSVLKEIAHVTDPPRPPETPRKRAKRYLDAERKAKTVGDESIAARRRGSLVQMFDWEAGTWLFPNGASGDSLSPATVRVALMAWSVLIRRQIAGQVPWDHPLSSLERHQWGSPFYQLVPPEVLDKRIPPGRIRQARDLIERR